MQTETVEVDGALFEVLAAFSEAATAVSAPWLVVGATARIILLEQVHGLPTGVATRDIDFGVQIDDWDHYEQLCNHLVQIGNIEAERSPTKRFRSKQDRIFDLVPYGGVENEQKQVYWPPHNDDVMTVRGFNGAANNAILVTVNNRLTVPVVSPVGLCALKLFAWEERHTQHPGRDAKDIAYLLIHIESLYTADMLHTQYTKAIDAADYVMNNAGYYQLGCDVKNLLTEEDRAFMADFLSQELEENEDSILCRELHKYMTTDSIGETLVALTFFSKGLCSES